MTNIQIENERAHLHASELLPWLVNGTLSSAERVHVEAHLSGCQSCRDELARQRSLHAEMTAREVEGPLPEAGLARLLQRVDEAGRQTPRAAAAPRGRETSRTHWAKIAYGLAAMLLLETGGLAVLSTQSEVGDHAAAYRTLSTPDASMSRATIRLVVDASMPAGRLQSLLVPLHLQIVAGPTENGVYSIGPVSSRGDIDRQVDALRAASGVRFVEPVSAD